ncbi:MAG: hypothetical protein HY298_22630 [Verrucomicrobia bacterium]|nr:hypothetical protein [Verrucomicrobiota bacterium]
MSQLNYRVRRATLDDLDVLRKLWQSMRLDEKELERRPTEFQVAEDANGQVIGAVALQITDRQGRLHSEAFDDFAHADQVRPLLWERLQAVANNHGLLRVWSQERAPFWNRCLHPAKAGELEKLPATWRNISGKWFTLQLRDETAVVSLDKEFALFKEAERQQREALLRHKKTVSVIATVIAIILAIFVLIVALRLMQNPQLLRH